MQEQEKAFLYSVNPRKVITGISGVNAIRTPKSLYLTRKDVEICLQRASVYRRFSGDIAPQRVTIGNLDRLHRENYIPEDQWDNFKTEELSVGHGKVEIASPVYKNNSQETVTNNKNEEDELQEMPSEQIIESDDEDEVVKVVDPVEDKSEE